MEEQGICNTCANPLHTDSAVSPPPIGSVRGSEINAINSSIFCVKLYTTMIYFNRMVRIMTIEHLYRYDNNLYAYVLNDLSKEQGTNGKSERSTSSTCSKTYAEIM